MEKEQLLKKIERLIDKKMLETGKMGTEEITVSLNLTDEEKEIFLQIDKYDNENYSWEFIEGSTLYLTYTEDLD